MVPGDFIGNPTPEPDLAQLFPSFQDKMQGLKPIPTSQQWATKKSVLPDLPKARHDARYLLLQRPYDDPYRVLNLEIRLSPYR